jgi:Meiotically up-regulated gene 113
LGARKASEIVMLTCRMLHFSRVQSSATVVTRPETTSSSHRGPRAMALIRRARRSRAAFKGLANRKLALGGPSPRATRQQVSGQALRVTGNDVESRIASARVDPTFLLADVEIVATYELFNVNRVKLENLIHKFFEPARLDLEMKDRFGKLFRPREWFLVPLDAIDDAVRRIKDGSIMNCRDDVDSARVVVV